MDKTAGSVRGGDEVYLLCDKVQKGEAEALWELETLAVRVISGSMQRGCRLSLWLSRTFLCRRH